MSRIHTREDFEGGLYDEYRRYPFFESRAALINERFGNRRTGVTLIAGGGYGYLADELTKLNWPRVWSLDASPFALTRGRADLPARATRIVQGDVLNLSDLQAFVGGTPSLIITEDLLPCADSDVEVGIMLENLRAILDGDMCHIITPMMDDGILLPDGSVAYESGEQVQVAGLLWRTREQWRDLIGADAIHFTHDERWN